MIRLAAAALAVLVVAVWALGVSYGAPTWLTWGNFTLGVIALASLGMVRTGDVAGFATWPVVSMVLLALWLFGLRSSGSHALAWADLVLGLGFVGLTVAALTAERWPRRRFRVSRPVYRT